MRPAFQALASALLFTACAPILAVASAGAPTWFTQSWYFDWTPSGTPLPIPITAQCETIHITWDRKTATGPDPIAPYYLQIYSSNYIFPFIVPAGPNPKADVTIPFAPGSQYEICMFDSNGNTGGCQGIYTVYPNSTSCANWTMPTSTLNVTSESFQGSLSMYGWVDSCSDIKLTPQNGTPPFTFTVAPALHPPLNITSNDMSPINWTVALSWASPFFISLVDSTGLSWSNGPIHSGNGKTQCLDEDPSSHSGRVPVGATVGAAVGGAVFGGSIAFMAALLMYKRRADLKRRGQEQEPIPFFSTSDSTRYDSLASQLSPPADERPLPASPLQHHSPAVSKQRSIGAPNLTSTVTLPQEYSIEPYQFQGPAHLHPRHSASGSDVTVQSPQQSGNDGQDTHARTTSGSVNTPVPEHPERGGSQVYVIHHDSGRAPVSVITSQGTEVVELPPGYSPEFLSGGGGARNGVPASAQRRQRKAASGSRWPDGMS